MRVLEVKNLTKRFGGLVAVNGVSFAVDRGELFGLIGPNGSGKSVFFNTISGVYKDDGGDIFFNGERINGLPPYAITSKGIGRTFQGSQVFPELTALENVMVGRHCRTKSNIWGAITRSAATRQEEKETEEKAVQLLEMVGMAHAKDSPVKDLTYVMRSLVGIAIALATEPSLLLLDEPLAGMNPTETANTMEIIRRIHDGGVNVLLVEHHMRAIMGICDRIVVLNMGNKIAEGTPEEICQNQEVIEAYLGQEVIC